MEWDLGLGGLGLLAVMAVVFGAVVHVVARRRTTRWIGLVATAVYFVAGLFVSEVWFGWATEEDLQPNVDGLSFDEVLLLAPLLAVAAMFLAHHATKRAGHSSGRLRPRAQ